MITASHNIPELLRLICHEATFVNTAIETGNLPGMLRAARALMGYAERVQLELALESAREAYKTSVAKGGA